MRNRSDNLRNPPKKRLCPTTTNTPTRDPTKTMVVQGQLAVTNNGSTKRSKNKSSNEDSSSSIETKLRIGKFLFETGLDPNTVNLPSFQAMISSLCSEETKKHGIPIPTCNELNGWIFDDVMKEINKYVDEVKKSWAHTGCTVILDGWTDKSGRNLVNVLVDCPKGAVFLRSTDISDCIGDMDAMISFIDRIIFEVGLNNVIQIMTYSVSDFMKEVGKKLMDKYRPVFWTVSASCCIELMLEKLKGIDLIRETLESAKIISSFVLGCPIFPFGPKLLIEGSYQTRPFLILEEIVVHKEELKKMFFSSSNLGSTEERKKVADLILSPLFWHGANTTLSAAIPLVKAIEWMSKATNKEQIGYIYETIDQVKETIKEGFSKESQYIDFWKAIDEVWSGILYSPLHSAGYFFNPNLFYSNDVYVDPEVTVGVLCCIVRTSGDLDVQNQITLQMEKYRVAAGTFGLGCADQSYSVSPVLWWLQFGSECPELQRLCVRILSQTCDGGSRFQLKRSLVENLLTKEMSSSEQEKLEGSVFLRYNMHLKNIASGNMDDVTMPDETGPTGDDWIAANKGPNHGPGSDDVGSKSTCVYPKVENGHGNDDMGSKSNFVYPKVENGATNPEGLCYSRLRR